jgi:ParB/RepB/Spo0J family partition protein
MSEPLHPVALNSADLLRLLASAGLNGVTPAAAAKAVDRRTDNVRRSLDSLVGAGYAAHTSDLDLYVITAEGRLTGLGLDVAAGRIAIDAASRLLRHAQLEPDPANPRKTFDEAELGELASSLEGLGILQPILVRPNPADPERYYIVAGERRWRAAGLLIDGGSWDAGQLLPCRLDDHDEDERPIAAVVENLQRVGLPPLEEARAFRAELDSGRCASTADIAGKIGRTQRYVQVRLQLLQLPAEAQTALSGGLITVEQARALVQTPKAAAPAPSAPDLAAGDALIERMRPPAEPALELTPEGGDEDETDEATQPPLIPRTAKERGEAERAALAKRRRATDEAAVAAFMRDVLDQFAQGRTAGLAGWDEPTFPVDRLADQALSAIGEGKAVRAVAALIMLRHRAGAMGVEHVLKAAQARGEGVVAE